MAKASENFCLFKDCLARRLLAQPGFADSPADSPESIDDFTAYLSTEIWPSLPPALLTASHETRSSIPDIDPESLPLENIPVSFIDTLISCGIVGDPDGALSFLRAVLKEYVSDACAPPPIWSRTRKTQCEICERDVPLTYHHLIPRQVHSKALKQEWHAKAMLNSVAWLCRPCHSTVHRLANNEQLAKEFFTVDRLLEREDLQKWRKYISKQR